MDKLTSAPRSRQITQNDSSKISEMPSSLYRHFEEPCGCQLPHGTASVQEQETRVGLHKPLTAQTAALILHETVFTPYQKPVDILVYHGSNLSLGKYLCHPDGDLNVTDATPKLCSRWFSP